MTTDFKPDVVSFGDLTGAGMWDDGHHREHLTFQQTFAAQTPPIVLADYNLLSFLVTTGGARQSMLQAHAKLHDLIRPLVGVTGVDLSAVDLDKESDFYVWLGHHAAEHAQIRQFLGLS